MTGLQTLINEAIVFAKEAAAHIDTYKDTDDFSFLQQAEWSLEDAIGQLDYILELAQEAEAAQETSE